MADLVRGRHAGLARAVDIDRAADAGPIDAAEEPAASHDVFRRAVAITDKILRSLHARSSFSVTLLEAPLETLLQSLLTSETLLLPFFRPEAGSADAAQTAVNVCVLSMKIGAQLGYARDALLELGLTALLHQAGVGRSSGDDLQLVQGLKVRYAGAVTVLGLLRERANRSGGAADGSDADGEPAHIVALASLIDGLVRRRPPRSDVGHSEIIKEILKRERGSYPHEVLKAAIRILASLPVGALVRLNTGEICRVVSKKDGFPLRPIVAVLVRQHKRVTEPSALDLSQHPFLRIQGFVTESMLHREAGTDSP